MKYAELLQVFAMNSIHLPDIAVQCGILADAHSRPSEGFLVDAQDSTFRHLIIKRTGECVFDQTFTSEDDMVAAMIKKITYNVKAHRVQAERICDVTRYLDAQVNGYKGFLLDIECDKDIPRAHWKATEICPDGTSGIVFLSDDWSLEDLKKAKETKNIQLEILKKQIDQIVLLAG